MSRHFYYSLFLHMIILMILVISFEWSEKMPVVQNSDKPDKVIHAMVIEDTIMPKKITQKPMPPIPEARSVRPPLKSEPKPKEIPVKKEVIAIPDKTQKKLQEDLIHQELLADLNKQKEIQKKQKQKAIQVEFEKEIKDLRQKNLAKREAVKRQGMVDKYKALILQAISQYWRIPSNVDKKLSAELLIRLAPGGAVLDVQLIKSSGEESLDRSAVAAVIKASPLPVPPEPDAFDPFRQFVLKVKPENVLSADNVYQ